MSMNPLLKTAVFATGLVLASGSALAKLSPEELDRLGTDLTPMGAIRAGSEDGMVPEWTGRISGLPEGLNWEGPGKTYPDPFADENPLFVITAENMDQYRERLSPGQIAMFETYPETFRMPVYPSHRDFRYPDKFYAKVRYNAENVELYNNDEGIRGFTGGPAFPIPKTGAEVVWLTRTTGSYLMQEGTYDDIAVFPNGTMSVRRTEFIEESPYASLKFDVPTLYPSLGKYAGFVMTHVLEPARDKGLITSVLEVYDYAENAREVWRYLPGSRRVRRAPTIGFDTPDGPGGLKTVDEVRGFNGSLERFSWELIGRKEVFIPYHNYRLDDPAVRYDTLLTKFHINPDYMRYELHRVYVAEATLREGMRHIYGKRRIYVDEDTGLTAITENYDGRGELWKVVMFNNIYEFGGGCYARRIETYHDLRAGAYIAERLINNSAPYLYDQSDARGEAYFLPTNIRKLGRR